MSEAISKAKASIWEFRMAIFWFALFSLNSLGSCMLASLTGAQWNQLDGQSKFMICLAVFVNWTGTIMAFVSSQAKRIQQTGQLFPTGDTTFITRGHSESVTDSFKISPVNQTAGDGKKPNEPVADAPVVQPVTGLTKPTP